MRRVEYLSIKRFVFFAAVAGFFVSSGIAEDVDPERDDSNLREVLIPSNAQCIERGNRSVSGLMTEFDEYTLDSGEHVGSRYYYTDEKTGDRQSLAIEATYREGKLHGNWKHYYRNGQLFLEIPYRQGKVDGVITYWDRDGGVMGKSRLVRGNGLWTSFSQRWGADHLEVTPYQNGVKHGIVREYGRFNQDGGIGVNVTEFVNGLPHGFSRVYDEDGTLRSEGYLVSGARHGVSREWNRDGNLVDGYPQFYICPKRKSKSHSQGQSQRVSREEFMEAARNDTDLKRSLVSP